MIEDLVMVGLGIAIGFAMRTILDGLRNGGVAHV